MKLIILLISLAIERFTHVGESIQRFTWFDAYLGILRNALDKGNLWQGIIGVILALVPIIVAVAIVYYLLCGLLFGLIGIVLAVAILFYCFGPRDLYKDTESYFVANAQNNEDAKKQSLSHLLEDMPTNEKDESRAVTKAIFHHYNQGIFAVSFWFIVLGPLGAVLYRVVERLVSNSKMANSQNSNLLEASKYILDVLDWIPIRLVALGYALMGDFSNGFAYWFSHAWSGLEKNRQIAEDSGLVALHLNDSNRDKADINENKQALNLIHRNTIVYLVVVAVFVLGAWIY